MTILLRRTRGAFRWMGSAWIIVGLTLLAILLLEGSLCFLFFVKDMMAGGTMPDPRVIAEGYGGATWPIRHYHELERLSERWEPYVYFRQHSFAGQTITIDERGFRRTWQSPRHPTKDSDHQPFRVWMFGGSSLWGFGARDDWTIPSLVAQKIHEHGIPAIVGNFSEIGYVSTQEVVAMVRALQAGDHPDLVIFYDGVNESTSALLEGEAGLTTNERNRRAEFNIRQSPSRLGASLIGRLVGDSATYRLAQSIGHRLLNPKGPEGVLPGPGRRQELVDQVVRRYQANLAIVEQLGRGFGFHSLHFWQPMVFAKKQTVPFESEAAEKLAWARPFLLEVYEAVRVSDGLRNVPRFHDLSRVFDEHPGLVFIDYCHTTEAGNEVVAESVAREAIEALEALGRGPHRGDAAATGVR